MRRRPSLAEGLQLPTDTPGYRQGPPRGLRGCDVLVEAPCPQHGVHRLLCSLPRGHEGDHGHQLSYRRNGTH
jgi:hypothetical protein